MRMVDIYELEIGDRFMEDTYPEIYKVTGRKIIDGMNLIVAVDLESGIESEWGYTCSAYAPCIIKI